PLPRTPAGGRQVASNQTVSLAGASGGSPGPNSNLSVQADLVAAGPASVQAVAQVFRCYCCLLCSWVVVTSLPCLLLTNPTSSRIARRGAANRLSPSSPALCNT